MANKIQFRRDTAANWTSANPTLSQGELGFETDTNKFKVGTGSTAWNSLSYTFNPSISANQDLNTNSNVTFANVDVTSQVAINRLAKYGVGLSNIEIAEDDNLTPQTNLRTDLGISGKSFGRAYLNTTTVGTKVIFPDASEQTTAWTGSVSTSSVTGLSVVGYSNNYNDLSNKPTSWSTSSITGLSVVGYTNNYNDLSNKPTDQSLNTTNNVQFVNVVATGGLKATTGTQAGQAISAGGYPLDNNGQALIAQSNTQSAALIVSNYTSNIRSQANIRSYGQNLPNGGATTAGQGVLVVEGARGTGASPTATGNGDSFGVIHFSGYDGSSWLSSQGTGGASQLAPVSIFATSVEAFANNGSTTTNAGATMGFRVQPIGVQLNSTSRRIWLGQTWTAGSTTTNTPPSLNINLGQSSGDATPPTLIPSSGVGSYGTGSGRINWSWSNTAQFIYGVPTQDTAPDNAGLTGTNILVFSGARRSGASGRRDPLLKDDTIGAATFYTQTASSGTTVGSYVGNFSFNMEENAGTGARGTRFVVQTVNTGTTTLATRFRISDRNNYYNSDNHVFNEKNGSFTALSLTTSSAAFGNSVDISYNRTYAAYYNTATITPAFANSATTLSIDGVNGGSFVTASNISIANSSQLVINKTGKYNIQFSLLANNADNGAAHDADFWFRKNGSDIANSNTQITVQKASKQIAAWNFIVDCTTAGDYFEIAYNVTDLNLTFPAIGAQTGPVRPATPSVIITIIPVGA